MSEPVKWKNRLLSSSVPMEYEVSKILASEKFAIDADYSYSRIDATVSNTLKDFSVDIKATAYPPYDDANELHASLTLFVECKHRHRTNKWLFFPDPNEDGFSSFTLGRTIHAVDEFSSYFLDSNCTVSFDEDAIFCIKGVEIDLNNGNVIESEIKHGLAQLQYALPQYLAEEIKFNVLNFGDDEENRPFFYCSILLTTSEIYLAKSNTTIKSVEDSSSIDDFSSKVPYVIVYNDYSPDFDKHRERACNPLIDLIDSLSLENLEALRVQGKEYEHLLPLRLCEDLIESNGRGIHGFFSQTIVCSIEHFPSLVQKIKEIVKRAVANLSKEGGKNVILGI